jgi:putative flippase GtrA
LIVRALKFGAVGIANTALDVGIFSVLTLAVGLQAPAANVVSYSAGIALSFALNRVWTFRDRNRQRPWSRLALFATGNLVGLALSTAVVASLVRAWGPLSAKAVSVGITFAWNYIFANFIVFKRS